jgi:hypothetical protein
MYAVAYVFMYVHVSMYACLQYVQSRSQVVTDDERQLKEDVIIVRICGMI